MENVRLLHSLDKPSNLRHIVKAELKSDYGIKVPKQKKLSKRLNQSRNSSQDGLATGIFGNFLSFVPSKYVSDCGFVPSFLVEAADLIEENADLEGIFRKSGSVSRQKEIKQQVEEGQPLDVGNIHDVTALVKQFFRELPEPLFTSVFHDAFLRCFNLNHELKVNAMLALCLLLPMEHLSTLRFTMCLLSRLAARSQNNKMDAANLAVVLAPNIMHCGRSSQKMNSTEEKLLQSQTAIVELLIRNAERIGVVSDSLYERTVLMGETWGTEDELEASDDNTLDDSKDVKEMKKKRRKRSSSLQGLVSSIGRGLSKLRRNSEGKNNSTTASSYSLANESDFAMATTQPLTSKSMSAASSSRPDDNDLLPSATPVVMRKRKMSGEIAPPFSATKRKAILDALPQKSALGHTPFTPASAKKPPQFLNQGTPSMFAATPKPDPSHNKSMRKKLNLFSPASNRKAKRCKSTGSSNLCSSGFRKSTKAKHIFKRLSGGRDKEASDGEEEDGGDASYGDMLDTSPPGTTTTTATTTTHCESTMELSTPHHSGQHMELAMTRTVSSPSIMDTSMGDLNEGFIDPDMTTATLDFTTADRASSSSGSSSPPSRGRTLQRGDSFAPRGNPVRRSASTDGNLRRGQPNKLCNGLLEGKTENVKKLRRSFDKSDIGLPIPHIVPVLPQKPEHRETPGKWSGANNSVGGVRTGSSSSEGSARTADQSMVDMESSLMQVVLPPPSGFGDQSVMEVDNDRDCHNDDQGSDNESEAGFSTISGGTVIHNPGAAARLQSLGQGVAYTSMASYGSSVSVNLPKSGPTMQSSTSIDSLFSTASESSATSSRSSQPRGYMDRTLSVDSGKGSLVDMAETKTSGASHYSSLNTTYVMNTDPDSHSLRSDDGLLDTSLPPAARPMKSVSAEDLKSRPLMEKPAPRSQSMHVISSRKMAPNLHISAETHRLLNRAGYLSSGLPPNVQDSTLSVKASPQKGESSHSHSFFNREDHLSRCSFRRDKGASSSSTTRKEVTQSFVEQRCSPVKEETSMETASFMAEETSQIAEKEADKTSAEDDGVIWVKRCDVKSSGSFAVPADPVPKSATSTADEEQTKASISLKRAEVRMQKHDSVLRIQERSSGRVADNVRQINSSVNSSMDNSSLDQSSFSSSFNTSSQNQSLQSRKRGVSPVRIPTIFATGKGGAPSAEYYRQLAQKSLRSGSEESKEGEASAAPKIRSSNSHHQHRHHSSRSESREENAASFAERKSQSIDLSASLMDTIEDVLTPARQRHRTHHREERPTSPLRESTNTKSEHTVSTHQTSLDQDSLGDTLQLRTSKGLTPHQILRVGAISPGSPRTPGKGVKRLQSAQRSPRRSPQSSRDSGRIPFKSRDFHEQY